VAIDSCRLKQVRGEHEIARRQRIGGPSIPTFANVPASTAVRAAHEEASAFIKDEPKAAAEIRRQVGC
jgi:hypothetical protein